MPSLQDLKQGAGAATGAGAGATAGVGVKRTGRFARNRATSRSTGQREVAEAGARGKGGADGGAASGKGGADSISLSTVASTHAGWQQRESPQEALRQARILD